MSEKRRPHTRPTPPSSLSSSSSCESSSLGARALCVVASVRPSSRTRVVTHTRTLSTTIETTTIETTTTANAGVFTNDDGAREAAFAVDDGQ